MIDTVVTKHQRTSWDTKDLLDVSNIWIKKMQKNSLNFNYKNDWWSYAFDYKKDISRIITAFTQGIFKFSPMIACDSYAKINTIWEYKDRLILKFLSKIIKPAMNKLIPTNCYHLNGLSGIKKAIDYVKTSLDNSDYRYFIRADIKDYYGSINRAILSQQVANHFNDQRILKYFDDVINIGIDYHWIVTVPDCGIHRGSSLSPMLGALYLRDLDLAFNNETTKYARFMDDIVILTKTKKQFLKAKRKLKEILCNLKLTLSRTKTKMGELTKGFHFLGVDFAVARTQQDKIHVKTSLHQRTLCRAIDKINAMKEGAVNTEKVLRYLSRWAAWWGKHFSFELYLFRFRVRLKIVKLQLYAKTKTFSP